ncbi:MAG: hypothetical protein WAW73_13775 [Rhodoferax sp.]|jgi:hypothetical protein
MRKAISRIKSSFASLVSDQKTIIDASAQVESIRTAMLDALACIEPNEDMGSSKAWTDIARAADTQTLWYLRSDVLRLLSDFHGEQLARDKLEAMTEMFRGLVPPNQMPSRRRVERR